MIWPTWLRSALARFWTRRNRPVSLAARRGRPAVESLEDRSLPSAGLTLAALGDSLTAPYAGQPYGEAGDQNWVEQLRAHDAEHLAIDDAAVAGATSADLLAKGGQVDTVADLVQQNAVHYAALIVGANDVSAHLSDFVSGNPAPFVAQVVANIETALDRLAGAGRVRLVVGNLPDITLTPAFQYEIAAFGPAAQALSQEISGAVAAVNRQIETFAAARKIPVVDLNGLGKLARGPFVVGGVDVVQTGKFYSPDFFHPGTIGQGVLANAILDAFAAADAPCFERLRLTDQQILGDAGLASATGRSFFDVRPYVLFADADDGRGERRHADEAACFSAPSFAFAPGLPIARREDLDRLFADGADSPFESGAARRAR